MYDLDILLRVWEFASCWVSTSSFHVRVCMCVHTMLCVLCVLCVCVCVRACWAVPGAHYGRSERRSSDPVCWGLWTHLSCRYIHTHYGVCWDLRTCLPLLSLYTHMECAEVFGPACLSCRCIHTLWSVLRSSDLLASPVVNAHTMECCICLWPTSLVCTYTRHWVYCRSPDPLVSLLSGVCSHMISCSYVYLFMGRSSLKVFGVEQVLPPRGPPWGSSECWMHLLTFCTLAHYYYWVHFIHEVHFIVQCELQRIEKFMWIQCEYNVDCKDAW